MADDLEYLIDSDGNRTSENSAINEFEYIYGEGNCNEVPFAVNIKWDEQIYSTEGQTYFKVKKNIEHANIFVNGSLLSLGADYTITKPHGVTFLMPLELNDVVVISGGEAIPASSVNQKVVTILTTDHFPEIDTNFYSAALLNDGKIGGTFYYDSSKININNGGTIYDGWVRDYTLSNYSLEWFGSDNTLVDNLLSIYGEDGAVVHITQESRGGTFIYDSSKSGDNDGGTVLNGWVRQYSGRVHSSWFDMGSNTAIELKHIFETFDYVAVDNLIFTMPANTIQAILTQDTDILFINSVFSHAVMDNPLFMFVQQGNFLKIDGLEIDGKHLTSTGIWTDGSCDISNCEMYNMNSNLDSTRAIKCILINSGSQVNIHDNYIHDIDAKRGVPVNTGSSGSAMGIYVSIGVGGIYSTIDIYKNDVRRCFGSEGSSIYISNINDFSLDNISTFKIRNNHLVDASRRMIKSQVRQVKITNNHIVSLSKTSSDFNVPASIIGVMTIGTNIVDSVVIERNNISNREGTGVTMAISEDVKNVTISGNILKGLVIPNYIQINSALSNFTITNNKMQSAEQCLLYLGGNIINFSNNDIVTLGRKIVHVGTVNAAGTMEVSNNIINIASGGTPFLGVVFFDSTSALSGVNVVQGNTIKNLSSTTDFGLITISGVTNDTIVHAINNIIPDKVLVSHASGIMNNVVDKNNYSILGKTMSGKNYVDVISGTDTYRKYDNGTMIAMINNAQTLALTDSIGAVFGKGSVTIPSYAVPFTSVDNVQMTLERASTGRCWIGTEFTQGSLTTPPTVSIYTDISRPTVNLIINVLVHGKWK